MTIKPYMRDALAVAAGAAILLIVILVINHFQESQNPAEQMAAKTRRIELAAQMQVALVSSSEAEKSAVLAVTDEDSKKYADQARAAAAEVERARVELAQLLTGPGEHGEKDLLTQFNVAFAEFQRVDKDLLALAVANTNLKASSLAFGPAAAALAEMDAALARLAADDVKVMRPADDARIAAWRILALIPPHIAEESDQKMDEMESRMNKEDQLVRQSLDALAAMPALAGNPDLKTAVAAYARFTETKSQILKLSRENTNVRSLAISLGEKRKVMMVCQAALAALEQAIQAEPVSGITHGNVRPR